MVRVVLWNGAHVDLHVIKPEKIDAHSFNCFIHFAHRPDTCAGSDGPHGPYRIANNLSRARHFLRVYEALRHFRNYVR